MVNWSREKGSTEGEGKHLERKNVRRLETAGGKYNEGNVLLEVY